MATKSGSRKRTHPRLGATSRVVKLVEQQPTGLRDLGDDYVPAFVTFMDILGFKQIVESSEASQISNKLDAVLAFSQLGQRRRDTYAHADLAPMVMQFSDSIIRIQPVPPTEVNPFDLLIGEIDALCMAQGNLVCNGILVRGGLTFGNICVRPTRAFGPAFIRAYKIESELARYPRILIDERLCAMTDQNPLARHLNAEMHHAVSTALSERLERNDDGQYAIQYLTHLFEAEHPVGISGLDVLMSHRDQIETMLEKAQPPAPEEARAKIRWVANYHNRWIERAFDKLDQRTFESTGRGLVIDLRYR